MELVNTAEWAPNECAFTLKDNDPEGFFDSGMICQTVEPRVYVSVSAVREMAAILGLVDASLVAGLQDRIAELEVEVAEADIFREAIDSIESAGLRARRKAGRKPRSEVAV